MSPSFLTAHRSSIIRALPFMLARSPVGYNLLVGEVMARKLTGYAFYRNLLKGLKRQVREIEGPEPPDLRRYYRSYAGVLEHAQPESCQRAVFLESAVMAGLALVGDFHTLDQAQRQYLGVVRELYDSGHRPVLALEMVQAGHDAELARYVNGEIEDDGTFLDRIGFFRNWGFDFMHYKPILAFARSRGLRVHGINADGGLKARDLFMAKRLLEIAEGNSPKPVIALVGDLHLGPRHLPRALEARGLRPVLLFQNSETVIMRRLREGLEPFGWFQIDDSRFLVNNTAPWVKVQTNLTWLEHGGEALCAMQGYCKRRGGESEDDFSGQPDLTETLHEYIRVLKDLFGLALKRDDDFQVFTMKDLEFLDDPYYRREPGRTYAKIIRDGRALFVRRGNIIYIPLLDVNRTVQEAAHYLMGADLDVAPGAGAFFRRLHYFASGFVASKLINPMRRYRTRNEMMQVREDYGRLRTRKERAYARRQLSVLNGTLDFFDAADKARGCSRLLQMEMNHYLDVDRETLFGLSEQIGFQLGEGLFSSYNKGELSGEDLKHYIFTQHDPFHFHRTYDKHLEEVVEGSA